MRGEIGFPFRVSCAITFGFGGLFCYGCVPVTATGPHRLPPMGCGEARYRAPTIERAPHPHVAYRRVSTSERSARRPLCCPYGRGVPALPEHRRSFVAVTLCYGSSVERAAT